MHMVLDRIQQELMRTEQDDQSTLKAYFSPTGCLLNTSYLYLLPGHS